MKISVLTVFSALYEPFLKSSLIGRAHEQKLIEIDVTEFRSFSAPKERIDAPTFGHGAGMLIKPEVIERAIDSAEKKHGRAYRIFLSPHGKKLNQKLLKKIMANASKSNHMLIVASRYEGMDARVEEHYADIVVSVGDFVLMGGDLPAMMLIEGGLRLIPGVVGRQESVDKESFSGPFVDHPEYTHPVEWKGMLVPEIVRSGDHAAMKKWRDEQAIKRTVLGHMQWLASSALNAEQKKAVLSTIPSHYVALMHSDVTLGDGTIGTTSVTSLDIHDIARSCKTYGIARYFIVTPLIDQQKIVRTLLDFWQTGGGVEYNSNRHQAFSQIELLANKDQLIAYIEKKRVRSRYLLQRQHARIIQRCQLLPMMSKQEFGSMIGQFFFF